MTGVPLRSSISMTSPPASLTPAGGVPTPDQTSGRPCEVSHDRAEEELTAKARWFMRFSAEARLKMLFEWSDTMERLNPSIAEVDRAGPIAGRIQVLERP